MSGQNDAASGQRRIAVVLDTSSSMGGAAMRAARRALAAVVASADRATTVGLVVFEDTAQSHAELAGGDTEGLRAALGSLVIGGRSNLSAGLLAAATLSATGSGSGREMIVVSDGRPNLGVTDLTRLVAIAAALAVEGVRVSTVGVGDCDAQLLAALARAGGGSHAVAPGSTPTDSRGWAGVDASADEAAFSRARARRRARRAAEARA